MGYINFFGKVDRNDKGNINSPYPAWYFDNSIAELQNTIKEKQDRLARHEVPYENEPEVREQLRKEQERLDLILSSKPELSDKESNMLYKTYKRLSELISDSLFTRSEMLQGTADAHKERIRQKAPSIPCPELLAQAMGLRWSGGAIGRDDAVRAWQIIGKLLGLPTNSEHLRKDRATVKSDFRGLVEPHYNTEAELV